MASKNKKAQTDGVTENVTVIGSEAMTELSDVVAIAGEMDIAQGSEALGAAQDIELQSDVVAALSSDDLERSMALGAIAGQIAVAAEIVYTLQLPELAIFLRDKGDELQRSQWKGSSGLAPAALSKPCWRHPTRSARWAPTRCWKAWRARIWRMRWRILRTATSTPKGGRRTAQKVHRRSGRGEPLPDLLYFPAVAAAYARQVSTSPPWPSSTVPGNTAQVPWIQAQNGEGIGGGTPSRRARRWRDDSRRGVGRYEKAPIPSIPRFVVERTRSDDGQSATHVSCVGVQ